VLGEVLSDDGHGGPVVGEQVVVFSPFGMVGKEVFDRLHFVHIVPITPPLL